MPAAPPYFRFADAGEVETLLASAGFADVSTEIVPQHWRHATPDQVFDAFHEGAVRATAMLRSQPEEVRNQIKKAVRSDVEALREGQEYVVPVPAALSVGFKTS